MLIVNPANINKQCSVLTDRQIELLITLAEEALLIKVNPVSNKKHLSFGATPNDFVTIGPYWWPNPDTDDGLPYIRKDGQINPISRNTDYYDRARIDEMGMATRILSTAWAYTGNERYKTALCQHIDKWFVDKSTRMNPNLEYAQHIPGVCTGRDYGIIDTTVLVDVFDSAMLVDYPKMDELRQWIAEYTNWLKASQNGISESKKGNNHGLWYDTQVMAFSAIIGDEKTVKETAQSMKLRLSEQVADDGSFPLELERTRSYTYSFFALRAVCYGHIIAAQYGYEILDSNYKKCFDFLVPYISGEKEWPLQDISTEKSKDDAICIKFGYDIFGDSRFYDAAEKRYTYELGTNIFQLRFPLIK